VDHAKAEGPGCDGIVCEPRHKSGQILDRACDVQWTCSPRPQIKLFTESAGKVSTTDPDSHSIPVGFGFVQGYNAQAAVNEQQILLAAEITNNSTYFSQLGPMVTASLDEIGRAGVEQLPEAVAADPGCWNCGHSLRSRPRRAPPASAFTRLRAGLAMRT
jgi:hypothetical protein